MSRAPSPVIAGLQQPGKSDVGTGKASRQAKQGKQHIGQIDIIEVGEKRVVDFLMKIERVHDLDVGWLQFELNKVLADTNVSANAIHFIGKRGTLEYPAILDLAGGTFTADRSGSKTENQAEPMETLRAAIANANRVFANKLGELGVPREVIDTLDKWQATMRAVNDAQHALTQHRQLLELNARISALQEQASILVATHGAGGNESLAISHAGDHHLDPMKGLTAAAMGERLGKISAVTVRKREEDGALFSVLASGRTRGRLYPAFQAWKGVVGKPLQTVLAALRDAGSPGGSTAHVFFAGATDLLGNLTPVEALIGAKPG